MGMWLVTDWVSVIECMRLNIGYQSSFIPSLLCGRASLVQRGRKEGQIVVSRSGSDDGGW